jgi:imidazolonepropionase-like amidohydrolase
MKALNPRTALAALALAGTLAAQPPLGPETGFIIRGARIFDGTRMLLGGEVWVRDGRIQAVGRHVHTPAGTPVVDGTGDTLLPGLIDAHTHAYGNALRQALAFGVTTELDMFTSHAYAAEVKRLQASGGGADQADLRSAGTLVTAPRGHGTEFGLPIPVLASAGEAQAFVDARIAEGSDYIKVVHDDGATYGVHFPTLDPAALEAVVRAAHARHRLAVAHIGSLREARNAVDAGVDGLAHLFVDVPPDEDFAARVAARHTFVVPTLSVLAAIAGDAPGRAVASDPAFKEWLGPEALRNLSATFPGRHGAFANALAAVRQLKARGVPILAGTDAPNPGTTHGASLHGELALLVRAGLTPLEALASATSVPARAFGLGDRGGIRPGLRADLLLVQGDPGADILATRRILQVWKAGTAVDRSAFQAGVRSEGLAASRGSSLPAPAGSASGLISDFDGGGEPTAAFGAGWRASTDELLGGGSKVTLAIVSGGAEGTPFALGVQGTFVQGPAAWAGAMFFPGAEPMAPANLSGRKVLSFWARGDGRNCQVLVYTRSQGYMPARRTFQTGPEWHRFEMPLAGFGTDGHDLTGILFGGGPEPGPFAFAIDTVRLD